MQNKFLFHNLLHLSNYIINQTKPINFLKLNYLIYYSHTHHLINRHQPLFQEAIEAWVYGPIIPDLYFFYRHHTNEPLNPHPHGNLAKLTSSQKQSLDYIIKKLGHHPSNVLAEQIINSDPWDDAFNTFTFPIQINAITNKAIQKYYQSHPL
ncbi:Panacea domain-containing protein [Candidatus Phytoplasma pruni]|uniref:DUF4065 domain-containing protein n=1 Tax=Candidatus Phytoplasma pruni TaxID=479893 RepID=A0A851HKD1_9MOLU|nr:type II toxin-antitoxin system antitoxin SocA domain-containing protein [Candidatus Phytoplasma pruni]NWN45889.1 DUF4065 domain-containing protein [Candidatus Phytoplasma pruni]